MIIIKPVIIIIIGYVVKTEEYTMETDEKLE